MYKSHWVVIVHFTWSITFSPLHLYTYTMHIWHDIINEILKWAKIWSYIYIYVIWSSFCVIPIVLRWFQCYLSYIHSMNHDKMALWVAKGVLSLPNGGTHSETIAISGLFLTLNILLEFWIELRHLFVIVSFLFPTRIFYTVIRLCVRLSLRCLIP